MNKNNNTINLSHKNENGTDLNEIITIYKDKEDVAQEINSPILRHIIENVIKEEHLKVNNSIAIEFKALTKEEAKQQIEELSKFRSDITELRQVSSEECITDNYSTITNKIVESLTQSYKDISVIKEDGFIKMKSEVESTVIEINEEDTLVKVNKVIEYFKNKNLQHDAIWDSFKSKISVSDRVDIDESLDLTNMKAISDTYLQNKDVILETFNREKPLGELGEYTLNELIVKGNEVISPIYNNLSTGVESAFAGLSLFLMYKGVVKLFDSLAFKEYPENISADKLVDYKRLRAREVKTFMVFGAPFIVGSLYAIKQLSFGGKVKFELESVSSVVEKDKFKDVELSSMGFIGLISFFKNKLPNCLKYLILIGVSFIYLNNFINKNVLITGSGIINSILMNNLIYLKIFFVIGSISSMMIIFYYLFNIYIYINYSNNKIKTPIYLPQFMINWVSLIERMSKYEDKGVFIKFYIKLILLYLIIFILCISILFKLSFI